MSNVRINESPNHFIVLDAIGRGVKTIDKIAKVTRLDKAELELIANDLTEQRLVIRTEKKGFFGRTKMELTISQRILPITAIGDFPILNCDKPYGWQCLGWGCVMRNWDSR